MKKLIILFFLFPLKSFCQCPLWIGSSIENAMVLKPLIQQFLLFDFNVGDTLGNNSRKTLVFEDNQGIVSFKIRWEVNNQIAGSSPVVRGIHILGPAEKIDQLFDELKVKASQCQNYMAIGPVIKFSEKIMQKTEAGLKNDITLKSISIKMQSGQ
ncbi:hypothetical protein V9K67_26855 [Paraflavisolibacter sp. H34]|uniref:hypothetical protein n=1 Tax=Huijunlia imazamoxiresistens TaxID=3127457 RepID=UPI003017BCB4